MLWFKSQRNQHEPKTEGEAESLIRSFLSWFRWKSKEGGTPSSVETSKLSSPARMLQQMLIKSSSVAKPKDVTNNSPEGIKESVDPVLHEETREEQPSPSQKVR